MSDSMIQCDRCGKHRTAWQFSELGFCSRCTTDADYVAMENARSPVPATHRQAGKITRARQARAKVEREMHRRQRVKTQYGLSADECAAMIEAQQNLCAICDRPPPEGVVLNVDHDHETGDVRGLLCQDCNMGLGFLRDDIDRMERAIDYLVNPPADDVLRPRSEQGK